MPVLSLALWAWSLTGTSLEGMSALGLLRQFPPTWYLALALALFGALYWIQERPVPHRLVAAHVGALTVILYATVPLLEQTPRYAYVYKHLAVTQYIERYGSVDPSIDIYHRWPGFFALTAWFSEATGLGEPIRFAAWAELLTASVEAVLVWAVVYAFTRRTRRAWYAATLFTTSNWVGQNYYAPQALGMILMLAVLLLVMVSLQHRSTALSRWVERRARALARIKVPAKEDFLGERLVPRRTFLALLVVLDVVLVISHQLTPYVLLLQLTGLVVIGVLQPFWTVLVLGLVTVGYLIPNLPFIIKKYGLLDTSSPTAPVGSQIGSVPIPDELLISRAATLSFLMAFGLGMLGVIKRARQGHLQQALVVTAIAFVPVGTLLANSYGGEGRLRIYLYALPWCLCAASWLWWSDDAPRRLRTVATTFVHGALATAMFLMPFLGHEDLNNLSPDEIAAARYIADPKIVAGDLVASMTLNVPPRYGPLSYQISYGDAIIYLSDTEFGKRHLMFAGDAEVDALIKEVRDSRDAPTAGIVLVFTRGIYNWSRDYQYYRPHELQAMESAVVRSGRFTTVMSTPTARIYRLPPEPSAEGG